jgi:hypothetical protein
VLPLALGVGKSKVDPLDLLFLDHVEDGVRVIRHDADSDWFVVRGGTFPDALALVQPA